MEINTLYLRLSKYIHSMDFNCPTSEKQIKEFELNNHIKLPFELIELLLKFNGGEIFIPGTTLYGINYPDDISNVNSSDIRKLFHIPNTYLIFGVYNFGDFICVNLNTPYDVIQWDHETDEEFYRWTNIKQWLSESIDAYEEYEGGAL